MPVGPEYIQFPMIFLEAQVPLRASVHLHMPLNDRVIPYKAKGDELTLSDLMELKKHPSERILGDKKECDEAMASFGETFETEIESAPTFENTKIQAFSKRVLDDFARFANSPEEVSRLLDETADLVHQILLAKKTGLTAEGIEAMLYEIGKEGDEILIHNRRVSGLAALISINLGLLTPLELSDLALGAVFHDIGLREMPETFVKRHLRAEDLSGSSVKIYSPEQTVLKYAQHIEESLARVRSSRLDVPAAVIRTIEQHHENFDGSGFKGVKAGKIFLPARILRIADDLVCLMNTADVPRSLSDAIFECWQLNRTGYQRPYDPVILDKLQAKLVA